MATPGTDGHAVPLESFPGIYMVIPGTDPVTQLTNQFQQVVHSDGSPAYLVDASGYGCVPAGFVSMSDWEDKHESVGFDGDDVHYSDVAHENIPYLYYVPSYGYTESPYNPYNPYIPGALLEGDGVMASSHRYYSVSSYGDSVLLPAHIPVVIQSSAEATYNGTASSFASNTRNAPKVDKKIAKHKLPSDTANSSDTSIQEDTSQTVSQGGKAANTRSRKSHPLHSVSDSLKGLVSSKVSLAHRPQGKEIGIREKGSSDSSKLKSSVSSSNGPASHGSASNHETSCKPQFVGNVKDAGECLYTWNSPKNELVLKAYTTKAGNPDSQGNIRIFKDHYNRSDFPTSYVNANFFVIKSYSEDDVHKSVKYNVWSSTPVGNKKLNAAYEDAQKLSPGDSNGCPIFLFFSVNASGQFCGVAEMIGPVDFQKDMDFWHQDKWSGCFPVIWHMIKDVPNPIFRHITLDNNEHKPVTNSRDTQEIPHKKGLDMLRIFKKYNSKTSLLDDFMYYENRQLVLLQERARLKHNAIDLTNIHESISSGGESSSLALSTDDNAKGTSHLSVDTRLSPVDALEIGSVTINTDAPEFASPLSTATVPPGNVITIGSMPVSFTGPKAGRTPPDTGPLGSSSNK